ncbi:DHHA2 domain-containing protein [Enorma burkinafasonensis]|uniref:DHH family phosphoesterase n=1 Tax=Enorma burkinafasonensis TaxID=2590867 RepID=UPI0026EC4154|nr:DHHA2 domain-containing protein [Enorma burkinafasonensis]MCI7730128.1 DHH family phosphoesterase [Enorma burkinafasonensis]
MAKVLVFGHQNPDNDAIMSAVVLAQLLNQVEYLGNEYEACALGPLPAESAKLLAEAGLPEPRQLDAIEPAAEGEDAQQVVLTDHNEPGQSVVGLENAQVIGVVDHHRFGDFTTAAPLHIVALPWGSSCSIVAKLFDILGQEPTDVQARLLLSAMMTDTLMLKSPTATAIDAVIAKKLGEQLGVDPVKFGMEVFLSRPSGSFTPAQMVGNDIKLFEVAGTQLLIGQYETVDKSRALGMIPEIREAMRAYQAEKGADGIVLCVTDIMEEGSQVLLEGETAAAQKGLGIEDVPEGVWMPGVLSRKKQVAAPILAAN